MSDPEAFQLVTASSHHKIFDEYEELHSAHGFDQDTSLQKALRGQFPGLALTVISAGNSRFSGSRQRQYKLMSYPSQPSLICK